MCIRDRPHAVPFELCADVIARLAPSHVRAVPNPKHCLAQLSQNNFPGPESLRTGDHGWSKHCEW
eukprot:8248156-Alexandrium_andersonii.AAC.1